MPILEVSITGRGNEGKLFSSPPRPDRLWAHPAPPILWVTGDLSPGVKRPGEKLNTHFHLVPELRMRGAIPPLPIRPHGVALNLAQDMSSERGT